ncbi:MAG: Gldg family protein [Alphaproteobacteria bacterium]|nr:Gldg family protein [Alphaproteobacteria bacterium]
MTAVRRYAWAVGLVGATLAVGFAVRTWLLGGVDDRGAALAVAGAIVLVLYTVLDRDRVEATARSPVVRQGTAALALVGGAALVAVLAQALVRTVDDTVDLTRSHAHSLSEHTLAVLDGLSRDVHLAAAFRQGAPGAARFEDLSRRYTERSPHVTRTWIDPLREPLAARDLGITSEQGEVVVQVGDRTEHLVGTLDEDALTEAIVRLTSDREHVICWSEGHGEADPDDVADPGGMGGVVVQLEGYNDQVLHTNLLTGAIDPACEVVVVARPTIDFLAFERRALADWVAGGGQALVLLEPGVTPALAASLRTFGVDVGDDLVLDPDPDASPLGVDDPSMLVIPPRRTRNHPLTAGLRGAVLLGVARSVGMIDDPPGVAVRTLLHAGAASWAERDLTDASATFTPDDDERQGDVPVMAVAEVTDPAALVLPEVPEADGVARDEVAVAVTGVLAVLLPDQPTPGDDARLDTTLGLSEPAVRALVRALDTTLGVQLAVVPDETVGALIDRAWHAVRARTALGDTRPDAPTPRPGGRIVVVGDASFAGNRNLAWGSNRDLFLDTIAWLTREDDQLGARPQDLGDVLPVTGRQEALIGLVAVVLVPGLTALLGLLLWLDRRRR